MNVAFLTPSADIEKSIMDEITQWSDKVLSVPNPHFNGLPACPYAKQAWLDSKVAVIFKYEKNYQSLYNTLAQFDDNFDIAILVDLSQHMKADVFHEYLDDLNTVISNGMFIDRDLWVMGFHPDDDESEFVEDVSFEPLVDVEYAMIFVQRLSKLQEAADKLDKKGYYDTYGDEYDAKNIYARREQLYRRLKDGNET